MVSDQEHEEAVKRGEEMFRTLPHALSARFDRSIGMVIVNLNWGYSIAFPPGRTEDLHGAKEEDLTEIEVSAPGWEIYFPKLDTGLWVPGLVKGVFGTPAWEEQWAAANRPQEAA